MKKLTYVILLFLVCLFLDSAFAQTIKSQTRATNVTCNHQQLGVGFVNVLHPTNHSPYTFTWSTGDVHRRTVGGGLSDSLSNLDVGIYTVKITDSQDAEVGTAEVTIAEDMCVMGPEAIFTPNADGYNDTWSIGNTEYYPNPDIIIYNRLGQKVHEQRGGMYVPWDGTDLYGAPVPDAAYYYVIYQNKDDKSTLIKGCVSIVR